MYVSNELQVKGKFNMNPHAITARTIMWSTNTHLHFNDITVEKPIKIQYMNLTYHLEDTITPR